MRFDIANPLKGLQEITTITKQVFDAHIHLWAGDQTHLFNTWARHYYGHYSYLGMGNPETKTKIEELQLADNVAFTYFLGVKEFGQYNTKELVRQVDEAHHNGYSIIKIWFAPRFVDFVEAETPYNIADPRLDQVYERIQDYSQKVIIHVADPDLWYLSKYGDSDRYGSKKERMAEFESVLENFRHIPFISAHLGCWPENLPALEKMLSRNPNLFLDTGSTRWMIRELGKHPKISRGWIIKHAQRILWGSDLSIAKEKVFPEYWATRFWSHRLFWETDLEGELPFQDIDNPFGTRIKGLNLPKSTLRQIYYRTAEKLLHLSPV